MLCMNAVQKVSNLLHVQSVHIITDVIDLTVQVYLVYSATSFQSEVELDWFMYTVRMTVLTSNFTVVLIWIHTAVLEHTVLHSNAYTDWQCM